MYLIFNFSGPDPVCTLERSGGHRQRHNVHDQLQRQGEQQHLHRLRQPRLQHHEAHNGSLMEAGISITFQVECAKNSI